VTDSDSARRTTPGRRMHCASSSSLPARTTPSTTTLRAGRRC
jgi:hypothetical protein